GVGRAVERIVINLPPKERACVLLKDVFDYTLEEIAELVGSTVGGVKAALNRGRLKLAVSQEQGAQPRSKRNPVVARVLLLYLERFNPPDWEAAADVSAAGAGLRVAVFFAGLVRESPYFSNYERLGFAWQLAVGEVDGELAIIIMQRNGADRFTPRGVIRVEVVEEQITRIAD